MLKQLFWKIPLGIAIAGCVSLFFDGWIYWVVSMVSVFSILTLIDCIKD